MEWSLSKRATPGDILLMYKCAPVSAITDVFVFSGNDIARGGAGWREGDAYFGEIRRMCHLRSPVFLDDLRKHRVLKTASFLRRNMQGVGLLATEYWPYLHDKFKYTGRCSNTRDVGSNTTLHCKRKDLKRCSPTRIPVQTEIDIAEWEE